MKYRIATSIVSITALVLVTGILVVPESAQAEPIVQDVPTKTMFVIGHGTVQILRLYDQPDPFGKTQKTILVGMPLEVYTDQLYNSYWYKTTEGFYAHQYYLSATDPNLAVVTETGAGAQTPEVQQREDELLRKYKDVVLVSQIMRGEIAIGFTDEMVRDSWGNPDSWQVLETTALGDRVLWEYDATQNRGAARLTFDYRKKMVTYVIDK